MEQQNQYCKSCEALLAGPFCGACGQKLITDRLTLKGVIRKGVSSIFNFERGLWYTMKMLFLNPGQVIRDYINGKTQPYYNPFRYALIFISISVFINLQLDIFSSQMDETMEVYKKLGMYPTPESEARGREIMAVVGKFLNVIPFLLLPFLTLATHLLFKAQKLYYAEHFVLNTFMLGHVSLVSTPLALLYLCVPSLISYYMVFGIFLYAIFYGYTFKSLFNKGWIESLFYGVITYVLGMTFFIVGSMILTIVIAIPVAIFMARMKK